MISLEVTLLHFLGRIHEEGVQGERGEGNFQRGEKARETEREKEREKERKRERVTHLSPERLDRVALPASGTLPPPGLEVRVQGSGCRVQGSGFRVQGSGFEVYGLWFMVYGLWFMI